MEMSGRGGGGVGEEKMLLQTYYNAVTELHRSKNYFLAVGGPGEQRWKPYRPFIKQLRMIFP